MMLAFCQLPKNAYPLRSHPARALVHTSAEVAVETEQSGVGDGAVRRVGVVDMAAVARMRARQQHREDAEMAEFLSAIVNLLQ